MKIEFQTSFLNSAKDIRNYSLVIIEKQNRVHL